MTSAHWRQTGGVWPLGVSTSLTWLDIGALLTLIQAAQIQLIIEIGVEHGGAAALFAAYCRYAAGALVYRGIDINLDALAYTVRDHDSAALFQRDAWAPETVAEVAEWMRAMPGPCLLFCDGGDKPRELHTYAPLLRVGDVLVGHDYHNEYVDDALVGLPADLTRVHADWLDDTLLCVFVRGAS